MNKRCIYIAQKDDRVFVGTSHEECEGMIKSGLVADAKVGKHEHDTRGKPYTALELMTLDGKFSVTIVSKPILNWKALKVETIALYERRGFVIVNRSREAHPRKGVKNTITSTIAQKASRARVDDKMLTEIFEDYYFRKMTGYQIADKFKLYYRSVYRILSGERRPGFRAKWLADNAHHLSSKAA